MRPQQTASLTIGAAAVALGALAILHLVRPDLEPSSHMISEYAIGPHGYLMTLSFAAFAISSATLFVALLRSHAVSSAASVLGFYGLPQRAWRLVGPSRWIRPPRIRRRCPIRARCTEWDS